MKINTQSPLFMDKLTSAKPEQETGFEDLIRQDDAYYWQHQNQLQQSAITFNPFVRDTHQTITSDTKKTTNITNPVINITANEPSPVHVLFIRLEKTTPECITAPELIIEQLMMHIEHITEQTSMGTEHQIVEQPIVKKTLYLKPVLNAATPSTFKNYQLFLEDNQVELTFNTTRLSKQHITALQKSVQHWLRDRGYTLKQLMINGVPQ